MKNLSAIIIEDEEDAITLFSTIIEKYCPNTYIKGTASTLEKGVELITTTAPDIVFLDIHLDGCDAFEILDQLGERDFELVFTTAHQQYALRAFEYEAVHYLLKPYSPKDIIKCINIVRKHKIERNAKRQLWGEPTKNSIPSYSQKICIATADGIYMLNIAEIIRIEADRSYCKIHSTNQKVIISSKPLKYIEDQLPSRDFYRSHGSHLINVNHVNRYGNEDGGYIVMSDNQPIPISRRKKKAFLDTLQSQLSLS